MEGKVLNFDETEKKGILKDNDGNRYDFTPNEWKSDIKPKSGLEVDFVAENNIATQIYSIKTAGLSNDLSEKVLQLQESDIIKKIGKLFSLGMHNKFGVIAAFALLVTLFLPVLEIPFLGTLSLMADGTGNLLFILLVVLMVLFYGGATRLYTKILAGITLGILFFQYYDLLSGLSHANDMFSSLGGSSGNSPNFFKLLRWGALVNLIACGTFFIAAFIRGYSENKETI